MDDETKAGPWASLHMKGIRDARRQALADKYTPEALAFADQVFAMCEKHYEAGGDRIVECFEVRDVIELFPARRLDEVVAYCGLVLERAADARWGEDSDGELEDLKKHAEWAAEAIREAEEAEAARRASHRWEC